jgi:hypothetical protein
MMASMTQDSACPLPAMATITRLGEDDWRRWREVRLVALSDSPAAFGSAVEDERSITEDGWRELVRNAAVFVASTGGGVAGAVAGLYRDSAEDRGFGDVGYPSVAGQWCRREARGCGRCLEPVRECGQGRTVGAGRQRQGTPVLRTRGVPDDREEPLLPRRSGSLYQRDVACTGEDLTGQWRGWLSMPAA